MIKCHLKNMTIFLIFLANCTYYVLTLLLFFLYYENTKGVDIMATTSITIQIGENLKNSMNKIPFEISADPFYSEENQRHLKKAITDLETGKGKPHDLIEIEDE